jgi:hypothetical protein
MALMSLTKDKVASFPLAGHAADQPTQGNKPPGPQPKSMPASMTKKDGGV